MRPSAFLFSFSLCSSSSSPLRRASYADFRFLTSFTIFYSLFFFPSSFHSPCNPLVLFVEASSFLPWVSFEFVFFSAGFSFDAAFSTGRVIREKIHGGSLLERPCLNPLEIFSFGDALPVELIIVTAALAASCPLDRYLFRFFFSLFFGRWDNRLQC